MNSNIADSIASLFFWGNRIGLSNSNRIWKFQINPPLNSHDKQDVKLRTDFCKKICKVHNIPAQILQQSWLERHVSILFSKICQFLTFYLVKSSPKNPSRKLERRRSICAGTVVGTYLGKVVLILTRQVTESINKHSSTDLF